MATQHDRIPEFQKLKVSRHAAVRMSQRSIPLRQVQMLLAYGDMNAAAGGATAITLDHRAAEELRGDSFLLPHQIDRLQRLRAITSSEGNVITVMHRHRTRRRHRVNRELGA